MDQPIEARAAYLAQAAGDDPALRQEVEELLTAATATGAPLAAGPLAGGQARSLVDGEADAMRGQRLGQYELVGVIGRGGMGSVYEAVRADDQYRKRVAIKLVQADLDERPHAGPVPARAPDPRDAGAPQHRDAARWRRLSRRPPVSRHGVRRGRADHPVVRRAPAADPRAARPHAPGLRRGAARSSQPRHPSRPQAGQHPRHRRRHGEAARLRHREAAR